MKNSKKSLVTFTCILALTLYAGCAAIEQETGGARRLNKSEAEKLLSVQATKDLARTGSTASEYVTRDPAEIEKQADSLVRNGEWIAALYQYQRLFISSKDPEVKLRARYKAGRICLLTGQYNQALQLFLYLCENKPDSAQYNEGLGLSYISLGETKDGVAALQKAVSLDNNLWRSHNALGIAYNQRLQPQDAVAQFQMALKLNGHNAMIYNNLGISYQLLGKMALAERQFNKALEIDPENTTAKNNLAVLMLKRGNNQEALWLLKESMGESKANHDLGMLLLWVNNKKESSKYLEQAIYLSPRYYPLANKHLKQIKQFNGGKSSNDGKPSLYIPKGVDVGDESNKLPKPSPGTSMKNDGNASPLMATKDDQPVINPVVSVPLEKKQPPLDTKKISNEKLVPDTQKNIAPKPSDTGASKNLNDKGEKSSDTPAKESTATAVNANQKGQDIKSGDLKGTKKARQDNPNKNWGIIIDKDGKVSLSSGSGNEKSEEMLIIQQK